MISGVSSFPLGRRRNQIVGVVLSGGLLFAAMRDVEVGDVARRILAVDARFLLWALVVDTGVFALKAMKWRVLWAPIGRPRIGLFLSAISVGELFAAILPLRLDELVRTEYMSRRAAVPRATVLGTVAVERAIDILFLASVLAGVTLATVWYGTGTQRTLAAFATAAAVSAASLFGLAQGRAAERLGKALSPRPGARLYHLRSQLATGIAVFPKGRRLLHVWGIVAAEWGLAALHVDAVTRAFRLDLSLGLDLGIAASSYLAFAVPSGPSAIGVFEFVVKNSLVELAAVGGATATGVALVLHAIAVIPIACVGALVLAVSGLSFHDLSTAPSTRSS